MSKVRERSDVVGYCIQVLSINDEAQSFLSQKSFYIENISKGGFRFTSDVKFELEDRVKVLLRFPDNRSQEVHGRICYSEELNDKELDNNTMAYGFSVIDGFYSLQSAVA